MSKRELEGQYAGFVSRAAGLVLDYLILLAVTIVIVLLTMLLFRVFGMDITQCPDLATSMSVSGVACIGGRAFLIAVPLVIGPLYLVLFWTIVGQTIGQRVMGLRVARLDGRRLGFWASVLRWLGYQLCLVTLGIGFLWVLVDDRRMGWHDKLARTCVIYSWNAMQYESFIEKAKQRFSRGSQKAAPTDVAPPDPEQGRPAGYVET